MKLLKQIHTAYCFMIFGLVFLVFFLPLMVPVLFPSQYRLVGVFNRWWAKSMFILWFLPYRIVVKSPLDPRRQYIFCPNHHSYLDIPTMGLNPVDTIFVGKNAMEKIPLFGYMYRKLHITVDRRKLRSRYATYIKSQEAIDEGKSLVIYPEGGIVAEKPPAMGRFKEGAFRLAIEKQIPIVPVTIPFNWILLPDESLLLTRGEVRIIFHEPIETRGMAIEQLDSLRDKVFNIINDEIKTNNATRVA